MKTIFYFFCIMLAWLIGVHQAAAQIVTNGDFETGDFTGWTLSGDTNSMIVDFVNHGGSYNDNGFTPYSGSFNAALETSGFNQLGFLSQTLTTAAGTNYLLTFWLNNPTGTGNGTNEFLVSWNGTNIFNHANQGATAGWTNFQFMVTATGTSTVLKFGFNDDHANFDLDYINVSLPPSNDNFTNRIPLMGAGIGNNFGATIQPNELNPGGTNTVTNTVWWSWTAPTNGPASVLTLGSGFDTIIDVYTGNSLTNLVCIASNLNTVLNYDLYYQNVFNGYYQNEDNGIYNPTNAGIPQRVGFTASAGTNYQIQIAGLRQGIIDIAVQPIAVKVVPPVNQVHTNANGSVNFNAVIQVGNSGLAAPGPLQLEVLARAGFSYSPNGTNVISISTPADQVLTNYYLGNPTILMPGMTTNISISGVCPPPTTNDVNNLGFGWGVYVVLQEEIGTNWFFKDNDLLFYGQWPIILGTVGASAGVIRLNPSSQITAANPGYVVWQLGPPAAVLTGANWKLATDASYPTVVNHCETVTSASQIVVQFKPIPGWNLPANQTVTVGPGVLITAIASYTVTNPVLVASGVAGLGITGTTGTVYEIDRRTSLTSGSWLPVSTNTILTNGFNPLLPKPGTNGSVNFYRAVWLGQ
jgi:hypothetical protein